MVTLAVATGLLAVALIVGLGVGVAPPGGWVDVPGRFLGHAEARPLPQAVFVVLLAGIAVAAGAMAWSAGLPGARLPRLSLLVVALVNAALAGASVSSIGQIRVIEEVIGTPPFGSLAAGAAGVTGLALAVAVAAVPLRWARGRPHALAILAALPSALVGAVYLALGLVTATLQLDAALAAPDYPPLISAQAGLAPSLLAIAQSASLLLAPFVIWQAATWARASGGPLGQRVADRAAHRPWILALLLTVKLGWLLAGYLGILPTALGGWSSEWRESLEDGPIGWGIALALAGVGGWWLWHPHRRRISRVGFRRAALALAIGFSSGSLLLGVLGLLGPVADAIPWGGTVPGLERCGTDGPDGGPLFALLCIQQGVAEWLPVPQVATVLVALVVGVALVRRRRAVPIGLFLVAIGVWALPRAINTVRGFVFGDAPAGTDAFGSVELATLDASITLVVAVLAAGWWTRRGPRADPWVLGLVLVVVTLMTRGSTLVLPGWSLALFYVALVFPLLYELGLDSEDLNEPAPDRPSRVLHAVGLRAGALTLLFVGLGAGFTTPDDNAALVAFVLFAPPFAAWLVAGVVSARQRGIAAGRVPVAAPARPSQLALGAAAGVLAVIVLVGASAAAAPLVSGAVTAPAGASDPPSDVPSPRARALELLARDRDVRDENSALIGPTDTIVEIVAAGPRMVDRARTELAWMAAHPPTSCSTPTWEARRDEMLRLEELGTSLGVPIGDEEAWVGAVEPAIHAWFDAQEATLVRMADLPRECGIVTGR